MERGIIFLLTNIFFVPAISAGFLFLPINWTEVARVKSLQYNEHFRSFDVSPMSTCDLTAHSCDLQCCIDPDCTLEQLQISKCSRMKFDKNEWHLLTRRCDSIGPKSPVWISVLCLYVNNAAILGYQYKDIGQFENLDAFQKKVLDCSHYRFINISSPNAPDENFESTYSFGSNVQIYEDQSGEMTPLLLPYPVIEATSCSATTSVPFLIDKMWKCSWPLTVEDCEITHSPLQLLPYVFSGENETAWQDIDVFPPKVVKNIGKKSFAEPILNVHCYNNGSEYIVIYSNSFGIKPHEKHRASYLPINEMGKLTKKCPDLYTRINTSYDMEKEICQNVVASVELEFIWHESEIIQLNARYALVDVPMSLETYLSNKKSQHWVIQEKKMSKSEKFRIYVTQSFKTTFKYQHLEGKAGTKPISSGDVAVRSGNPGYLYGKPLITGILRYNTSERNHNDSVHSRSVTWEDLPLELWSLGKSLSL
ncbi:tectonic-3-like [Hetaerina americana]|uniref:tectonic-3-like n=1 Tax=Hetaerina americana TaxID=62018 RepID=UPI003A7F5CC0